MERGGKDFLLEVDTGGGSYTMLGALKANSMSLNNEEIDITSKGSNQWKELLDGAGIRSVSISGSGVYDAESPINLVEDNCKDGVLTNFRIRDAAAGGRTRTGLFKITSFELSGEHNGATTYSISLSSSGEVTTT